MTPEEIARFLAESDQKLAETKHLVQRAEAVVEMLKMQNATGEKALKERRN